MYHGDSPIYYTYKFRAVLKIFLVVSPIVMGQSQYLCEPIMLWQHGRPHRGGDHWGRGDRMPMDLPTEEGEQDLPHGGSLRRVDFPSPFNSIEAQIRLIQASLDQHA